MHLIRDPLRRSPGSAFLKSTLLTRAVRNNVAQPRLYNSNLGIFLIHIERKPFADLKYQHPAHQASVVPACAE